MNAHWGASSGPGHPACTCSVEVLRGPPCRQFPMPEWGPKSPSELKSASQNETVSFPRPQPTRDLHWCATKWPSGALRNVGSATRAGKDSCALSFSERSPRSPSPRFPHEGPAKGCASDRNVVWDRKAGLQGMFSCALGFSRGKRPVRQHKDICVLSFSSIRWCPQA